MNPLKEIMNPRSIAFLGASNNLLKMGTMQLLNLINAGFKGPIYPIHPEQKTVLGLKAYPSVESIPEVPELLAIVLPTKIVPDFIEAAGKKGTRRAVIISGGFSEVGEEGKNLQARLKETAERYGIRFVGPNCIGLLNTENNLNTTPFAYEIGAGPIGLASHSGTYCCHTYPYLASLGTGFAEAISLGNEASIDVVDALEYFLGQPKVKVIALYLEGLRRVPEFIRTARRVAREKPIIALYVGGTEAGARAASTHTAAISGPASLFRGILRQAGVIQALNTEELFDGALALSTQPPCRGKRMAIMTNSGGPGAAMANACSLIGLQVPEFSPETQARLRKHLPHTGTCRNPVDVTFSVNMDAYYVHLPTILLENPEYEGLLIYGVFGPEYLLEQKKKIGNLMEMPADDVLWHLGLDNARQFAGLLRGFGKPVMGASFNGLKDMAIKALVENGVPIYPTPERAVRAMDMLCEYAQIKQREMSR
ncbi:MAG: acetate--CoA ligase family protein [Proteobacteria bacterium]|nr:acetate--CoA ligase family protein [Pseudomonadota bacterium]